MATSACRQMDKGDGEECNVRVVVRMRPLVARERLAGSMEAVQVLAGHPQICAGPEHSYTFDQVHHLFARIYYNCNRCLGVGMGRSGCLGRRWCRCWMRSWRATTARSSPTARYLKPRRHSMVKMIIGDGRRGVGRRLRWGRGWTLRMRG